MQKYIYIKNNRVFEIIMEYVDVFPNVHITDRYSSEFLKKCVEVDESVFVEQDWDYFADTGTFKEPLRIEYDNMSCIIESNETKIIELAVNFNGEIEVSNGNDGIEIMEANTSFIKIRGINIGFYTLGLKLESIDGREKEQAMYISVK